MLISWAALPIYLSEASGLWVRFGLAVTMHVPGCRKSLLGGPEPGIARLVAVSVYSVVGAPVVPGRKVLEVWV